MNRDLGNILNLIRIYLNANFCYVLQIVDGKFEIKKAAGEQSVESFSAFNSDLVSIKNFSSYKETASYKSIIKNLNADSLFAQNFQINGSEFIFAALFKGAQNQTSKLQTEYVIELLQNYF